MTERTIEMQSEVERGEVGIGSPFYRREKLRLAVGVAAAGVGLGELRVEPDGLVQVDDGRGERRPFRATSLTCAVTIETGAR
jgi:hypothetical protein